MDDDFVPIFGRRYDKVDQASRDQIYRFSRNCRRVLVGEHRRALSLFANWLRLAFGKPVLNERIRKAIKLVDESKVWSAVSKSMKSGNLTTFELPESNVVGSVTPVGKPETKVVKQAVLIDLERIPGSMGKFVAKGSVFEVSERTSSYSGPGPKNKILESLNLGDRIHVFGQLDNQPWYLIGHGVEGEFGTEPMGTGFAHISNFTEQTNRDGNRANSFIALPNQKPPQSAEFVEIDWIVTCSKAEFKLQKKGQDGVIKEVSTSCVGPLGIPISAQ